MRLQDVKGDVAWSALEAELIRCAPLGQTAGLPGKRDCPKDTTDPDRRVRAGLIRWLLLGGHSADRLRTHPKGVRLQGAWVDGKLDFEGCKTQLDCKLSACLFPNSISFKDSHLNGLYLPDCNCKGPVILRRVCVDADIQMRDGFISEKLVDLCNARISGSLACTGGQFNSDEPNGKAIDCKGIFVGSNIFFKENLGGKNSCRKFIANGKVDLQGAAIMGKLDCDGAKFLNSGHTAVQLSASRIEGSVFLRNHTQIEGAASLTRLRVGGNLEIKEISISGTLNGQGLTVNAAFFWRDITGTPKTVNLRHANVGVLCDDKESWQGVGTLHLDGLTYDRIDSAMTVADRIAWLDRNRDGATGAGSRFLPQPWTQLAKVLTASGDRRAASQVREAREARIARAEFRQGLQWAGAFSAGPFAYIPVLLQAGCNALFRWMFGYGHAPGRVFWWIGGLVVLTAALFGHIYDMGQMAPNSAVVLTSADWLAAVYWADPLHTYPMHIWVGTGAFAGMPSAIDYETFSRWLYAFDLFIPLDAIGQQQAWAPSHDRGGWGAFGYWARFPIQVAGWVIAAVGAAVVTGLLGKKDDG